MFQSPRIRAARICLKYYVLIVLESARLPRVHSRRAANCTRGDASLIIARSLIVGRLKRTLFTATGPRAIKPFNSLIDWVIISTRLNRAPRLSIRWSTWIIVRVCHVDGVLYVRYIKCEWIMPRLVNSGAFLHFFFFYSSSRYSIAIIVIIDT